MIVSEFRCLRCNFYWRGRRVLFDGTDKILDTASCPGPTDCPKCRSRYVKWITRDEDLRACGIEPCKHWDDFPCEDLGS